MPPISITLGNVTPFYLLLLEEQHYPQGLQGLLQLQTPLCSAAERLARADGEDWDLDIFSLKSSVCVDPWEIRCGCPFAPTEHVSPSSIVPVALHQAGALRCDAPLAHAAGEASFPKAGGHFSMGASAQLSALGSQCSSTCLSCSPLYRQRSAGLQGTTERPAAMLLGGTCCRRRRPARLLQASPVGVPLDGAGTAVLQEHGGCQDSGLCRRQAAAGVGRGRALPARLAHDQSRGYCGRRRGGRQNMIVPVET